LPRPPDRVRTTHRPTASTGSRRAGGCRRSRACWSTC